MNFLTLTIHIHFNIKPTFSILSPFHCNQVTVFVNCCRLNTKSNQPVKLDPEHHQNTMFPFTTNNQSNFILNAPFFPIPLPLKW